MALATNIRLPLDDHGNTPRQRRKFVCKKHLTAYCAKRKCVKQINIKNK